MTEGWILDGFRSQVGGMDSGKSPALISEAHYALGVNVSARGGRPKTRPAFLQKSFTSASDALTLIEAQMFQGAQFYYFPGGGTIIAVFGGKVVRFNTSTNTVETLTPTAWLSPYRLCRFVQADKYVIIQDGVNPPVIVEGSTARQSRTGALNPAKAISSVVRSGTTATVTTSAAHGFATGEYVEIENVTPGGYNPASTRVTVTGAATFTYAVDSTLGTATVTGATCRWAPEVPIGTAMAYGQGRLFVASTDRTTFQAGDIIYGNLEGTSDNLLRFTEQNYLAEGGDFAFPSTMGLITSMVFVPFQDSATGQGELLVMGANGVSSYNVSLPRTEWKNTQIQRVTFTDIGSVSPTGHIAVNNDVVFRTHNGVRSYRQARMELNNYGQTPISSEVSRVLDADDPTALSRVSAVYVDNRMLMTCGAYSDLIPCRILSLTRSGATLTVKTVSPHLLSVGSVITIKDSQSFDGQYTVLTIPNTDEVTVLFSAVEAPSETSGSAYLTCSIYGQRPFYRGIISLDFNSLSGVGGKTNAAYDGVWTGGSFLQLVSGVVSGKPRVFAFSADGPLATRVWEISSDSGPDVTAGGQGVPQACALETRDFDFQKPYVKKKLVGCSLWLSGLSGEGRVRLYYRPSGHPCWALWASKDFCAEVDPVISEADPTSSETPRGLPQTRRLWNFPTPPDVCDESTGENAAVATGFQLRIEWDGQVTVDQAVLHAIEQPTNFRGGC